MASAPLSAPGNAAALLAVPENAAVTPEAAEAAADAADLPAGAAVVLGRMAASVGGLPRPGDR